MIDLARNGRQVLAADVDAAIDMMVKVAGSEIPRSKSKNGSGVTSTNASRAG
jgi:hypothetical protein